MRAPGVVRLIRGRVVESGGGGRLGRTDEAIARSCGSHDSEVPLASFRVPEVTNTRGEVVGHLEVELGDG